MITSASAIGVVGIGQIGGSICKALRARGHDRLFGFDIDPATRRCASAEGVRVTPDAAALFRQCDLIVLAVPLDRYPQAIEQLIVPVDDGRKRILIDVGSASLPLRAAWKDRSKPRDLSVIGTHPMAGTERPGYAAADAAMFDGCHWAVLDQPEDRAIDVLDVIEWVLSFGARSMLIDPDVHDRAVARTSHLPHLLAMALIRTAYTGAEEVLRRGLAAGSFRDATRVANSAPGLTAAMCNANAAALGESLDHCLEILHAARRGLARGDAAALLDAFEQARALKWSTPATHDGVDMLAAPDADTLRARLARACAQGARIVELQRADLPVAPEWRVHVEYPPTALSTQTR